MGKRERENDPGKLLCGECSTLKNEGEPFWVYPKDIAFEIHQLRHEVEKLTAILHDISKLGITVKKAET